jgi:hypothetical protein
MPFRKDWKKLVLQSGNIFRKVEIKRAILNEESQRVVGNYDIQKMLRQPLKYCLRIG